MAEADKISSLVDYQNIRQEINFSIADLERLAKAKDAILATPKVILDYKGAQGSAEERRATEGLIVVKNKLLDAEKKLIQIDQEKVKLSIQAANAQKAEAQAESAKERVAQELLKTQKLKNQESEKAQKISLSEAKQAAELTNDYAQLSKAYNDAALKAKNYALQLGEEHPVTIQAIKDAKGMYDILLRVDQAVGQNSRNVGNYKSAFNGLGFSVSQVARELPSLAVSLPQFFLAISNNIPMLKDQIDLAKQEIKALKAEGKDAPSVFSRLSSAIFSANTLLVVAVTVLALYGKQLVDGIKSIFGYTDAQEKMAIKNEKLQKQTLELIKLQKELNDLYEDPITDANRIQNEINLATSLNKTKLEQLEIEKKLAFERAANAQKRFNDTGGFVKLDELKRNLSLADVLYKQSLSELNNAFDEDQEKELQKRVDRAKTNLDLAKEELGEQKSIVKENAEALIAFEVNANNIKEELSRLDRERKKQDVANARAAYEEQKKTMLQEAEDLKDLAFAQSQNGLPADKYLRLSIKIKKDVAEQDHILTLAEIQNRKDVLVEEEKRLKASTAFRAAEKEEQKAALNEMASRIKAVNIEIGNENERFRRDEVLADRKNIQDKLDLQVKGKKQIAEALREVDDQFAAANDPKKELERQLGIENRINQQRITQDDKNYEDKVTKLNDRYAKGKMSEKEYNDEREKIDYDYHITQLESEIAFTDAMLKVMKSFGVDVTKQEDDLAKLRTKLSDTRRAKQKKDIDDNKKDLQDSLNDFKEYYDKLSQIVSEAIDISITKKRNAIADEKKLNDENEANAIEQVKNSTLSEQEKANQILQIQAAAAAQRRKLEQEDKEAALKKAQFDKVNALFHIAIDTAQAVVKDLNKPWKIAFDIALGAAQAALVAAAPLPKFERGTKDSPEGFAKLHTGETVIEPSGRSYLTPVGETIGYLPRHSIVLTKEETKNRWGSVLNRATGQMVVNNDGKLDEIKEAVLRSGQMTAKAISKMKGASINIHNDAAFAAHINQQVKN